MSEEGVVENTEIILNVWYIYDDSGFIYSLRARCYIGGGSDEEKLGLLRQFATTDYLIAQPFPVPERFRTTLVREGGVHEKVPVVHLSDIETLGGPQVLFEEAFVALEQPAAGANQSNHRSAATSLLNSTYRWRRRRDQTGFHKTREALRPGKSDVDRLSASSAGAEDSDAGSGRIDRHIGPSGHAHYLERGAD